MNKSNNSEPSSSNGANAIVGSREWEKGFVAACAITLRNHGCDTIVEDTLCCNFLSINEMEKIGIDEFDIEILKPIVKEIERKRSLSNGC